MNIPQHIVIVPDGNRRWAKKKGQPSFFGHRAGMKVAQEIARAARDADVSYVTMWGASVSNVVNRSSQEVNFLFRLFETYVRKLGKSKEIKRDGVRVRILGRWRELFPPSARKVFQRTMDDTKKHDKYNLTLLMAYDGREEMLSAIRAIKAGKKKGKNLDYKSIKSNLWTKDLPPVDLVIRTGGEPHWSAGLMMWDVAETRLYFTKTLWPDFSVKEFKQVLENYSETERRFGR